MRAEANGWTLFEAGGVHLQAGQTYIGQLEERLRRLPIELAADKRVLWHAPDFLQLATSGMHKVRARASSIRSCRRSPAGRLVLLSEITPTALTRVLQLRPAVRTALELVRLRPLADAETHSSRGRRRRRGSPQYLDSRVEPEVIETVTHLARHYLGAGQMPGAVLDLLKLAVQRAIAQDEPRLTRDDVLATMSQLTGMPAQVLDDRERVDLAELRAFLQHARDRPGRSGRCGRRPHRDAEGGADRSRASRSACSSSPARPAPARPSWPRRSRNSCSAPPSGSIRLDMSEFQSVESMRKIVGDPDRRTRSHALTDRVRKQPFSVVLLDEFEKAHRQRLGPVPPGVRRRPADRCAGPDRGLPPLHHHPDVEPGQHDSSRTRAPGFLAHVAAALSPQSASRKPFNQSFRPEFVNRLDRIIVFRPLGRERHAQHRGEGAVARARSGAGLRHREWAVEWEASALEFLLDNGFSPAMGARPLKRAIDEHLLAPLAATLVEHRYPEGDQFLFVRSDGRALQVEFVDPDASRRSRRDWTSTDRPRAPTSARADDGDADRLAAPRRRRSSPICSGSRDGLADDRWIGDRVRARGAHAAAGFLESAEPAVDPVAVRGDGSRQGGRRHGRGLATRLERSGMPRAAIRATLIVRLASQLFLVSHGIEDVLTDEPVEVVLAVQPVLDQTRTPRRPRAGASGCWRCTGSGRPGAACSIRGRGARVATELLRDLRLRRVAAPQRRSRPARPRLRGLRRVGPHRRACHRHADAARPSRLVRRAVAAVSAVGKGPAPAAIVRRYRLDSSPIIRDLKQGWRTGRIDLVFDGHFDLIAEVWPAAAEERRS